MKGELDQQGIGNRVRELIAEAMCSDAMYAKRIGIDPGNFHKKLIGAQKWTINDVKKICSSENVSNEWLVDGIGDVRTSDYYAPVMKQLPSDLLRDEEKEDTNGIPYFDVDFLGGFDEMLNDQTIAPSYYIDIQPYNRNGNMWCNITGDSMSPRINSGDKICIQPLNSVDDIIYGEIYAIVTFSNMRTVKWVVRSPENGMIRLVPENKDQRFGDYQDISKRDVLHIFKVIGSIRTF